MIFSSPLFPFFWMSTSVPKGSKWSWKTSLKSGIFFSEIWTHKRGKASFAAMRGAWICIFRSRLSIMQQTVSGIHNSKKPTKTNKRHPADWKQTKHWDWLQSRAARRCTKHPDLRRILKMTQWDTHHPVITSSPISFSCHGEVWNFSCLQVTTDFLVILWNWKPLCQIETLDPEINIRAARGGVALYRRTKAVETQSERTIDQRFTFCFNQAETERVFHR